MKNTISSHTPICSRPLMSPRVRAKHEARIQREMPNPTGLVLAWCEKERLFIVAIPKRGGSWEHGHVSLVMEPHEAVKIELFIEACTLPIIAALQATAKGGAE